MATGKTIVITGVTRGIGRALVDQFIALGHTVHGCGRSSGGIVELRERYGEPHSFHVVDVAKENEVQLWAARIFLPGQAPDLLINNAAVINRQAPLWEQTAAEFNQLIGVNVIGPVNVIRVFAPPMIARQAGTIVNLSSGWGRSVSANVAPYCASKFAIEALSRAMALEVPQGLSVVALSPGVIDTDMLRVAFGEEAGNSPSPETWARTAAPYILALGPRHNGASPRVGDGATD
jgi:NAD(P)-dependent dehydrogenase (short-subunit alcohol dehydrogenase family)